MRLLKVEIVAHNAPGLDVMMKAVAVVGKMMLAVAVKLLTLDDDVAEEYVIFAAKTVDSFAV